MPANSALPDNLADCHSMIIEQRDVIAQQDRLIHSLRRELYGSRRERFVEGENGTGIETVTISSLLPGPADWRPDSRHRQARLS
jgi:hypothetical protein